MKKKLLFVLGAADPEMTFIERLLNRKGCHFIYALVDGERVRPGTAYLAEKGSAILYESYDTVYAVECGWFDEDDKVVHLDHHRPNDVGYGKPPEEYLFASSAGQVVSALIRNGEYMHAEDVKDLLFVAAADHCLGAAYRGECPGVLPEELMAWRIKTRAAFQNRDPEQLLAYVEYARKRICELAVDGLADLRQLEGGTLPEAPEAAAREGLAILSRVTEKGGRQKVCLLNANPETIQAFMAGTLVPGLTNHYGDPVRGYAGGYLS